MPRQNHSGGSETGIGWCLGRTPIKIARIATELRESGRTVQRNLVRLTKGGYIVRTRTPIGYSIGIRNSCKFSAFRRSSDRTKTSDHKGDDRAEMSGVTGHEWRGDQTEVSETRRHYRDKRKNKTDHHRQDHTQLWKKRMMTESKIFSSKRKAPDRKQRGSRFRPRRPGSPRSPILRARKKPAGNRQLVPHGVSKPKARLAHRR